MKNKLEIIYEDDSIVAVNKPARLMAVPAQGISKRATLMGRVRCKMNRTMGEKARFVYPLHRLDYATSGIVLFGKDPKERDILENIHRHNETRKTYLALVKGWPPEKGSMDFKVPARNRNILVDAHTEYRTLARAPCDLCTLVEVDITTGRRHQIRRHFARIKHPVVLDDTYGDRMFNRKFRRKYRFNRQFLHAWKLSFKHPVTGRYIRLVATISPDLVVTLKRLNIPLP